MSIKIIAQIFFFLLCLLKNYQSLVDVYKYYSGFKSTTNPNELKLEKNCKCDITSNYCDAYCCCDDFCNEVYGRGGTSYWKYKDQCVSSESSVFEYYLAQCRDKTSISSLDDLYNPIRVFYQNIRGGFCIAFDNSQNFTKVEKDSFVIKNSSDFTNVISKYKKIDDVPENSYLYNLDGFKINIPSIFDRNFDSSSFTEYQPMNPLIIRKSSDSYVSLKFPITSPYGICKNNLDMIRFLGNRKLTCGYKLKLQQRDCMQFNLKNILNDNSPLVVFKSGTSSNTYMKNTLEPVIKAYKIEQKTYYQEFPFSSQMSAEFLINSSTECKCKDIATRIDYEFFMSKDQITQFKISYYFEDFTNICGSREFIPVTYNVNFRSQDEESEYSRSGNPGYLKGKPLISGKENKYVVYNNVTRMNDTTLYIDQFSTPRLIMGIGQDKNDRGLCYNNILLSNINGLTTNQVPNSFNSILDSNDFSLLYFNFNKLNQIPESTGIYQNQILDNIITYDDNISWGCVDKLNILGLEYYCLNQLWKQKSFLNIINDLSYIGKFGNPNRHLILDWVMVEPFSLDSYQSIWDSSTNKCTIPSVFNVDILYGTFGLVNNTQHAVVNVRFRMDYTYWWSKNPTDKNVKDNFFSHLNINYFRIPQDKVWWYAPAPGFIKLNKNILYPFRFGTTTYGTATNNETYLKSIHNIYLFYLITILLIIL